MTTLTPLPAERETFVFVHQVAQERERMLALCGLLICPWPKGERMTLAREDIVTAIQAKLLRSHASGKLPVGDILDLWVDDGGTLPRPRHPRTESWLRGRIATNTVFQLKVEKPPGGLH